MYQIGICWNFPQILLISYNFLKRVILRKYPQDQVIIESLIGLLLFVYSCIQLWLKVLGLGNLIEQTAKDVGILMLIMLQIVYTSTKKSFEYILWHFPSGRWCKNIIISIFSVHSTNNHQHSSLNVLYMPRHDVVEGEYWSGENGIRLSIFSCLWWLYAKLCWEHKKCDTYAKFSHTHKIGNLTFMSCLGSI